MIYIDPLNVDQHSAVLSRNVELVFITIYVILPSH